MILTPRWSVMSRGIGIKDSHTTRMDDFEAELGLCRGGESLARSGEDDQPLAFRQRQQLIDVVQVALRQQRKRGAEDEPQPASGVLLLWAPPGGGRGTWRGRDDFGPDHG